MNKRNHCIGCQSCVDMCPFQAIEFTYNTWGEGQAVINTEKCKNCGLCERICPSGEIPFNQPKQTVYAMFSKKKHDTGSSGGVFYEMASRFIGQGGVVFGAAFDDTLKLVHKKAETVSDLLRLCKSKYLHSDMTGVYQEVSNALKNNQKVMFVGTPCQVSAVKKMFLPKYREQLFLVDFLCHGTGTQRVFDICVNAEQQKKSGDIRDFTFRAKTRKAEHSFRYVLHCGGKNKTISGYAFEFPYYHSYLQYNIFNEYCYVCQYASNSRVGDVTLGDFWGIQKYNKKLNDQNGVSMISVNTDIGERYFEEIRSACVVYEYPIQYASDNNQAFNESVGKNRQNEKHALAELLRREGEAALVKKLSCANIKKKLIYAKIPNGVIKLWNCVRGRK